MAKADDHCAAALAELPARHEAESNKPHQGYNSLMFPRREQNRREIQKACPHLPSWREALMAKHCAQG
jgi:hypothetical protein